MSRAIIYLRGGVIQGGIVDSRDMHITVLDFDVEGCSEDECDKYDGELCNAIEGIFQYDPDEVKKEERLIEYLRD